MKSLIILIATALLPVACAFANETSPRDQAQQLIDRGLNYIDLLATIGTPRGPVRAVR